MGNLQHNPTSCPIRANESVVNGINTSQKLSENNQKAGWTSKFNSTGSNSMATVTKVAGGVGNNVSSQINICLECNDVVENIRLKNMNNGYNQLCLVDDPQQYNNEDIISNLPGLPASREVRRLHTRSLIFE